MIDVEVWLLLSAGVSMALHASALSRTRGLWLAVPIVLIVPYALAETLAGFSVLDLHSGLLPIASVWAGWLLFESLLLSRWQSPLWALNRLWFPGFCLPLLYLQMHVYQIGWVTVGFDVQALIYAACIALGYCAFFILRKGCGSTITGMLLVLQWGLVFGCFAKRPITGADIESSVGAFFSTSLIFTGILFLGYTVSRAGVSGVIPFIGKKL